MQLPEVTIIGLGNLGKAFLKAFSDHKVPVKSIFSRDGLKTAEVAKSYSISTFGGFPGGKEQLGDLIFLTVPDAYIEDVACQLSGLDESFTGQTIVHCSGSESADLLDILRNKGAATASFHPVQTFSGKTDPKTFQGIYFSLQGSADAFPILKKTAKQLNSHIMEVTSRQKSFLHAGAVMASNYLFALLDVATEIGSKAGLSSVEVQQALLPLVKMTLRNAGESSYAEALTGPIKRGDITTVKKHLKLLETSPELSQIYKVLGLRAIKMGQLSGSLKEDTAGKLRELLEGV